MQRPDGPLTAPLRSDGLDPSGTSTESVAPIPGTTHLIVTDTTPALRLFLEAFTAADVAEPLLSFDDTTPGESTPRG